MGWQPKENSPREVANQLPTSKHLLYFRRVSTFAHNTGSRLRYPVQAAGGRLHSSANLNETMIGGFECVQNWRTENISAGLRLNPNSRLANRFPVVADLCCGLGGLSLAARQLGMTVVAGVDIGGDALRTFTQNFPEAAPIEATISGTKAIQQCESVLIRHRSPSCHC